MSESGDPPSDPPPNAAPEGDAPADSGPIDAGTTAVVEPLPPPIHAGHLTHHEADEPPLAGKVRRVDDLVGMAERILLFVAFAILILTGLYRTFVDRVFHDRPLWAIEVLRVSAFSIGMMGAAYATQNRRNFGLDLVSALMSAKVKAVTRVFTNFAALVAAGLLFYGGRLIQDALTKEKQHYEVVPLTVIGWFIPICALLIMFHVVCHMIIEIDYLRLGRTAPEPEVVG